MRRRFVVSMLLVVTGSLIVVGYAMAYGVDLSFPAASRSAITQGYSAGHQAYDYRFANHTPVAAAKAGTVSGFRWDFADNNSWYPCRGNLDDRGNYIILDHGGGVETRYFHLSKTGNTPGVGTHFHRGAYMALSDNTGCSTGPHLHFALLVGGSPRDPYAGTTEWVSGSPIPMGFRDQNGTVHGPYALDRAKIHDKWLALQGEPGTPLEDDYTGSCVQSGTGILAILYIQGFERGYIQYCGSGAAEYVAYAKTYLPDTKIDYNGWNSSVTTRSNVGGTEVSKTFYKPDGKVADSRAYDPYLATNANWTLDTSSFATDSTNPITDVAGSAVVAAGLDASVVVKQQHPNKTFGDSGLPDSSVFGFTPGTTIYLPIFLQNYYGWYSHTTVQNAGNNTATVTAKYYNQSGQEIYSETKTIAPAASKEFYPPAGTKRTPLVVIIRATVGSLVGRKRSTCRWYRETSMDGLPASRCKTPAGFRLT